MWGEGWCGKSIKVWCNNVAAISLINRGSSANRYVMQLARCLAFIKAKFELELMATHLPGTKNSIADALSRNKMTLFHSAPTGRLGANSNFRLPSGPVNHFQARLDLQALDRSVEFYFQNGLAASTRRSYSSAKN